MTLDGPTMGPVGNAPDLLLVEDNALHARLVTTMVDDIWPEGVSLRHVKRLEGAIEAVQEAPPSCVLLDLVLPDASRLEAVEALTACAPDLPLIVLSSHQNDVLALEAIRAGAQDYLVKGTATPDSLGRAILFAIERARTRDLGAARPAALTVPAEAEHASQAVLDPAGTMLYAEAAIADLIGRPLAEVIGVPLDEVCHPADYSLWTRTLEEAAADPDGEERELVVRYLHPSGADVRVRVELIALRGDEGERAAFLATFHPTSEEGTASSGAYAVVTEWSDG